MERDNEVALFNRSVEKLGLIYKQYIGHWDSNSYSTVCASYPDGPTEFIETEECISHVTKRMGTQLHEIVHRQKGNSNLRHIVTYYMLECFVKLGFCGLTIQKISDASFSLFRHFTYSLIFILVKI